MTTTERTTLALVLAFWGAAVAVVVSPPPQPPSPSPVVVDVLLESVHAELASKLRGVNERLVPAPVARAVSEVLVAESRRAGFDPWLIVAVIEVESRSNIDAVSPAGALGLMQILRDTFAEVSDHYSALDPVENVRAGIAYLAKLHNQGKGFVRLDSLLRAYNGGPRTAMVYNEAVRMGLDPLLSTSNEVHQYPGLVRARYRALVKSHGGDPKKLDKLWRMK